MPEAVISVIQGHRTDLTPHLAAVREVPETVYRWHGPAWATVKVKFGLSCLTGELPWRLREVDIDLLHAAIIYARVGGLFWLSWAFWRFLARLRTANLHLLRLGYQSRMLLSGRPFGEGEQMTWGRLIRP